MVHHNVVEHLPHQSRHELGRRYMLENAPELFATAPRLWGTASIYGGICVQDIAYCQVSTISTGSLVSYPHPYRVLQFPGITSVGTVCNFPPSRISTELGSRSSSIAAVDGRSQFPLHAQASYPATLKPAPKRGRGWLPVCVTLG